MYFTVPSLYSGGDVVHSYGRLIPHEFPITDLQQISGPDGIGRVTCTVSSGMATFFANVEFGTEIQGVSQTKNGTTATLVVDPFNVDNFKNTPLYCTRSNTNFLYLFISSASEYIYPRHGRCLNAYSQTVVQLLYSINFIVYFSNCPLHISVAYV